MMPVKGPLSPSDFIATAFHLLGVPMDLTLLGANDQPRKIIAGHLTGGLLA